MDTVSDSIGITGGSQATWTLPWIAAEGVS